jgi:hypothetical protein
VQEFIDIYSPEEMIAYTRNPSLLRVLGNVSLVSDVLECDSPEDTAAKVPHAALHKDGYLYHVGRYAPRGLYGSDDPANRLYNGDILKRRCTALEDKNTALAVLVTLNGDSK